MNRIIKILIVCPIVFLIGAAKLQAQIKFGNSPTSKNANSLLELESTNKGLLLPRVALTATNAPAPLTAHIAGMVVYNTATAGAAPNNVTPGYYYNDGTAWMKILIATIPEYDWRKAGNLATTTNTDTSATIYHIGSVGIGTNTVNSSAILQLNSTTQGFLPPGMTNAQIKAISAPSNGLVVYNTTLACMMYYVDSSFACVNNKPALAATSGQKGSTYTTLYNGWSGGTYSVGGAGTTTITHTAGETFSANGACTNQYISAQGCGGMTTVTGASGTVYNLVSINGQCWTKQNMKEIPSNFWFHTPTSWLNTNLGTDLGYWGYYNTATTNGSAGWGLSEPAAGEGLLYQWSAAMDNSLKERSRGICPTGFHIPSDCEWKYLEHGLGMSIFCQNTVGSRCDNAGEGNISWKLRAQGTNWNNASGFTVLLPGNRVSFAGDFSNRSLSYYYYTSTSSPAFPSGIQMSYYTSSLNLNGEGRGISTVLNAMSVRCLKD